MQLLDRLRRVLRPCLAGDNFLRAGYARRRDGVHLFGNRFSASASCRRAPVTRAQENGRKSGAPQPMRLDTAGIAVAFWLSMRPFFLAWLTVALLLLVLGKFTGA